MQFDVNKNNITPMLKWTLTCITVPFQQFKNANSFMKIPNEYKPLPKIIVAVPKNALDFYDLVPHFS